MRNTTKMASKYSGIAQSNTH